MKWLLKWKVKHQGKETESSSKLGACRAKLTNKKKVGNIRNYNVKEIKAVVQKVQKRDKV